MRSRLSVFQMVFLGIFCVAALIGIYVFATYSNKGSSSALGTVAVWGTLSQTDMSAALTTIVPTTPDLKQVSYVQKDETTLPTDLAAAIATGAAPDLVLASQEDLRALRKFITPISASTLSPATFTNAFVEEGSLFAAPDGFYGVPFLIDPLVLFTNRTILSSSGVAKPPTTWEALTGLVPSIAAFTPGRQITRGLIALGTYDNVHNARGILSTLFLQTGVPISVTRSGSVLAADLGESANQSGGPPGEAVVGFYTQFADPLKVSYTWNASLPDSRQLFLSGDLAFYLGYASEALFLSAANPNLDFGVAPIPQRATATAKHTYGLLYAFMIPNGARNASGAYQAAVLLTSAAEQVAAASATGLAPAALTPLATQPADPVAAVAYAEALYAAGWLSPPPATTDSVFSAMIQNVVSGRSSLSTALANAGRSLNVLLQQ